MVKIAHRFGIRRPGRRYVAWVEALVLLAVGGVRCSTAVAQSTQPPFRVTHLAGVTNLNNQRYASQFSGADAGARIAACIADLPAGGGTCIADFTGTQAITSDPFAGANKPGVLELGSAVFQVSATINIPSGWSITGTYAGKIWGLPDEPHAGTVFSWTGGPGQPVIRIFNAHHVSMRGFSIDGNSTANSTGILIDSNNNPPVHNIDIRDFNIYRTMTGIQWGTGALPDIPGYEVDKIQIFNGVIDSGMAGSKGIVVQGANKGQDSKIQAVTMVDIDTGIDLSGSYSYLNIEDCSFGSPVSAGHTDGILSIGIDNLVIKGGSSERGTQGSHFIHNVASPYNSGSATTVILNTRVNDPIVLEGSSKFLSLGNSAPTVTPGSISSISRSGGVVTVTTSTAHNLTTSDFVVISGVADASFHGNFAVASAPDSTHFTYAQSGSDNASSGGTALKSNAVLNGTANLKLTSVGDYLNNELGWTVVGGAQLVKIQESASSFPSTLTATAGVSTNALQLDAASKDVVLLRDSAQTAALRNGTNPQTFNVYNTYSSPTNFERGTLNWNAGKFTLGAEAGTGGGTWRGVDLVGSPLVIYPFGNHSTSAWQFSSGGHFLAQTTNVHDIGAAGGNRPRSAYVGSRIVSGVNTAAFSATPTFDAALGNSQTLTLSGNVTSSTLANAVAGQTLFFNLCQDATGGRSFVWPSNVKMGAQINKKPNQCTHQSFIFDGSNALALGPAQDDAGQVWLPLVAGWGGAIQMPMGLIADFSGSDVEIFSNFDLGSNKLSDSSQPSWGALIGNNGSDQFAVVRSPATSGPVTWTYHWTLDNNGISRDTASSHRMNTVTFSSTPTFDVTSGGIQKITLTGNVTSSTLSGAPAGGIIYFLICQDATGGRTFTWPANVKGGMTVGSTASKCSAQDFVFDGANAYALSSGATNM